MCRRWQRPPTSLSSSIGEIGRQVHRSKESTSRAVSEADRADAQIRNLAEAAMRIGDVVRLISEIAEQTNLLALERHHRGGAGRRSRARLCGGGLGSEEPCLPDRQGHRGDRRQGWRDAAEHDLSVGAVEKISHTIAEINEITTAIAAAIEEQGAATGEIARNVQQASAGTSEVASNVTGISQAATDTGQVATASTAPPSASSRTSKCCAGKWSNSCSGWLRPEAAGVTAAG